MFASLHIPMAFALVATSVTSLGLFAIASRPKWSAQNASLFGIAAAGLLLVFILLHLLPEALVQVSNASAWIVMGFAIGWLLPRGLRLVMSNRTDISDHSQAIAAVIAIAVHSFVDGVLYSVTFAADFHSGLMTALGLILHEFPEGVIAFTLLSRAGLPSKRAFFFAFLAAAATTPLGVLVSGPTLWLLGPDLVATLFAASVGLLLYVATGPLLLPILKQPVRSGVPSLAVGVMAGLFLVFGPIDGGHSHEIVQGSFDPHAHHDHDHHGHDHPPF